MLKKKAETKKKNGQKKNLSLIISLDQLTATCFCWITLRSLSTNPTWLFGMKPRKAFFSGEYNKIKTLISQTGVGGGELKCTQPA